MSNRKPENIQNLLLKGGKIINPSAGINEIADILIEGKMIKKVGKIETADFNGKTIDCAGKIIAPGFIDMHVHLREPGEEHKETVESGSEAAMNGGFTAICCMPNTKPPVDTRAQVEFIKNRSQGLLVDVLPIGAITKNREGKELVEMNELGKAGAVAFSDDGSPVQNAAVMRNAMEYAAMLGYPIIDHCEETSLSAGGMMNEGLHSTYAGLKTIPSISESIAVSRDVLIAEFTGCPVHIAHVSTEESVRIIREAKARDIKVTAETCPHYLVLTDEAVRSYDTNLKMNPPLRAEKDRLALIEGLRDGTIDVIATDHAPHHSDNKDLEFDVASFGITGLETSVGIALDLLVGKNNFSLSDIVKLMTDNARKILNLPEINLAADNVANITILDPEKEWTVNVDDFFSKSTNSPFNGWKLIGSPIGVINNQQLFLK